MNDPARALVQRLWSYCNVLRDDGLSYPDYVEQLTYLLFLKMADEALGETRVIPPGLDWPSLVEKRGENLRDHYQNVLTLLGGGPGMLGTIFANARNKIRDPEKLRLLVVDLIDRNNWSALGIDVKGSAYEGLLEKNAQDTKSGAGQYFTPRPVVDAIVQCVEPRLGEVIYDPACGTGGFLISAYAYLTTTNPNLSETEKKHLTLQAIRGSELVPEVTRLAAMNLFLHGIGPTTGGYEVPVKTEDSLAKPSAQKYDLVLTNPPFGKRSSLRAVRTLEGDTDVAKVMLRPDFWVATSNKELAFLQHVASLLNATGRAAVVIPDGVLTGEGASATMRRNLLSLFDVHTLLRLPTGIFYAHGVNANVLFFDQRGAKSANSKLWVYDLRTDMRFTMSSHRLTSSDLDDFVSCYRPGDLQNRSPTWGPGRSDGRWRAFDHESLLSMPDVSLNLSWLSEPSLPTNGPEDVDTLVSEIVSDLQSALARIQELLPQDDAIPSD